MRINQYIARSTRLSRRAADTMVAEGRVTINGAVATPSDRVRIGDRITLDHKPISITELTHTIALNKPVGYVCSKDGQGAKTVYDLLPQELHNLNPIGRLDKDSSGLLLLSNDGNLAHQLTHPSFIKQKMYQIAISPGLSKQHELAIARGVKLNDGLSALKLEQQSPDRTKWLVIMHQGRNRQIRRTFEHFGYSVTNLHRTSFGPYQISDLKPGRWISVDTTPDSNQ